MNAGSSKDTFSRSLTMTTVVHRLQYELHCEDMHVGYGGEHDYVRGQGYAKGGFPESFRSPAAFRLGVPDF